jgi:hypothetical protein
VSDRSTPRGRRTVTAALETVALYGLLVWVYVALVAAFRPNDLAESIAGWLPLRRDTAGTLCFAASAVAYATLEVRGTRPGRRGCRSVVRDREDHR